MAGLSHELRLILRRRRSGIAFRIRRRKPLTVRLGGGASGKGPKGGFVSRAVHRMRLRWVSAKWRCAAARMAGLYTGLMKDVTEGRSAMEAFHAKLAMESYFAVPSAPVLHLVKSH